MEPPQSHHRLTAQQRQKPINLFDVVVTINGDLGVITATQPGPTPIIYRRGDKTYRAEPLQLTVVGKVDPEAFTAAMKARDEKLAQANCLFLPEVFRDVKPGDAINVRWRGGQVIQAVFRTWNHRSAKYPVEITTNDGKQWRVPLAAVVGKAA